MSPIISSHSTDHVNDPLVFKSYSFTLQNSSNSHQASKAQHNTKEMVMIKHIY